MADVNLACSKETSSLSFNDLSPSAASLQFDIFFWFTNSEDVHTFFAAN